MTVDIDFLGKSILLTSDFTLLTLSCACGGKSKYGGNCNLLYISSLNKKKARAKTSHGPYYRFVIVETHRWHISTGWGLSLHDAFCYNAVFGRYSQEIYACCVTTHVNSAVVHHGVCLEQLAVYIIHVHTGYLVLGT